MDPLSAAILRQAAGMAGGVEETFDNPLQMPVSKRPSGDLRPMPGDPTAPAVAPGGVAINPVGQMSNMPILTGGDMWAALPNWGIGYD